MQIYGPLELGLRRERGRGHAYHSCTRKPRRGQLVVRGAEFKTQSTQHFLGKASKERHAPLMRNQRASVAAAEEARSTAQEQTRQV